MTKIELMETYTAEQLAEMVENLQKENLVELLKLKNREDTEDVSKVFDAMKLTITELCNTIEDLQSENTEEKRKHARTLWEFCDSVKKEDYEKEVNHLQSEVDKYRKAFEDAKKERDCQTSEYQKKIEELENRDIAELLPTDPIKVADMLINVMHEPCASVLSFGKPYSLYDMSELRQIAEHLLVYCNHNGESEE